MCTSTKKWHTIFVRSHFLLSFTHTLCFTLMHSHTSTLDRWWVFSLSLSLMIFNCLNLWMKFTKWLNWNKWIAHIHIQQRDKHECRSLPYAHTRIYSAKNTSKFHAFAMKSIWPTIMIWSTNDASCHEVGKIRDLEFAKQFDEFYSGQMWSSGICITDE